MTPPLPPDVEPTDPEPRGNAAGWIALAAAFAAGALSVIAVWAALMKETTP